LFLQRFKGSYHVFESKLLRNDGLDLVCFGKGGKFGKGVARETRLAAD
jgi:hypothetical protein